MTPPARPAADPVTGRMVAAVDFDGVLYPFSAPLHGRPAALPGAAAAMARLRAAGWCVVVLTSRLSPTWADGDAASWGLAGEEGYVRELLARDGIEVDGVTCEKVPAQLYVDDRAVEFLGEDRGAPAANGWPGVYRRTVGSHDGPCPERGARCDPSTGFHPPLWDEEYP